ncbi:MAG: hypothetical protein LBU78_14450 [Microbacterium sp.]|jgi:hypothetical protein|nr:hypothetical protein [Microbacterium sp.]
MYRSSYEAPDVAPSDDAVVLPDALNLPAHELPVPPAPVDLTPVEPIGTVPPVPPMPPLPPSAPAAETPTVPLPMSPQVARVRNERKLPIRALAFAGGTLVVVGIVVGTIAIVSGGGEPAPVARDQASITAPSDSGLPGERGGPTPVRTSPPTAVPTPTAVPVPVVPPAQQAPSDPPVTRAPDPAPKPKPKPQPSAPSAPKPAPSAPSTPAAPVPLAFALIKENRADHWLGIEVLQSYTLSMTGQPGSAAAVKYGWKDAGTVTFDATGRGTIDIGRSVLDLIPGNALVRAEYSDGTEGDAIEMRRKDIPT